MEKPLRSEQAAQNAAHIDPDLARIIDTWPTLSAAIRAGVLTMIDAVRHNG